uniref:Multivesicular body subunit 12A n=1 Tax=Parascaris univalens TaxID=6257 RepID=A0A915BG89_PARUN
MSALLSPSTEMGDQKALNPITAVVIVADKNKCPRGFFPITKTHDDQTDADLWKESSFSFFSRPVRYLAISREAPSNMVGVQVVTDLCVVKDTDPIPMGFIAIDYTADSKEKSLRKKYLCVRSMSRDAVVDAIGEIVVLNRHKKPPRNFSSAGEIDGSLICFRHVVIPPSFGISLPRSQSSGGLYPSVGEDRHSAPVLAGGGQQLGGVNALTIKLASTRIGVEDVPFKLNPVIESSLARNKLTALPTIKIYDQAKLDSEFGYQFTLERATLSNP